MVPTSGVPYPATGIEYSDESFGSPPPPERGEGGPNLILRRTLAGIRRYKWLILAIFAVGSALGAALTRVIDPKYDTTGTIWIAAGKGLEPIRAPGLLSNELGWPELMTSFVVLDPVVSELALYVTAADERDSEIFKSLRPTDTLAAGAYRLKLNSGKTSFQLTRLRERPDDVEALVDSGTVGDSIGRSVGFLWAPPRAQFRRGTDQYDFGVITPREAALKLQGDLTVAIAPNSNLMVLRLSGEQPAMVARTMNTLLRRFITEAARLKKANLVEVANTVDEQLRSAADQLTDAERSLESFKYNTITQPNENVAISPGVALATNPAIQAYFTDRTSQEGVRSDRQQLERIISEGASRGGRLSAEALRGAPALLANGSTGKELDAALAAITSKDAMLRTMLETYTLDYAPAQRVQTEITNLETVTIPQIANKLLSELREREAELNRRIDRASGELREIPQRTIEEARRMRAVTVASGIFQDLQKSAVNARLGEKTSMPDVAILDTAVAPRNPSSDTTFGLILLSAFASLGIGIVLAVLLDRSDGRFRYPEQATNELGLEIVGAIPSYTPPKSQRHRLEQASQMVESFRSLALTVRSAFPAGTPVQLTISSPGPADGKSTIAINLANALAEGGYRTCLVDGDIRRGQLHESCPPATQVPGLVDYLAGEATLADVIKPTDLHSNVSLIPCGTRRRQGPELLASQRTRTLMRELRSQFDAIVVDCAPLAAGIDAYAMGAATGSMLLVLRAGETDRQLARTKLETLDRLPIRILGTVLNDVGDSSDFRYYQYLEGYGTLMDDQEVGLIGAGSEKK
jgi:capsular exopolysaccharide synthesis family protein